MYRFLSISLHSRLPFYVCVFVCVSTGVLFPTRTKIGQFLASVLSDIITFPRNQSLGQSGKLDLFPPDLSHALNFSSCLFSACVFLESPPSSINQPGFELQGHFLCQEMTPKSSLFSKGLEEEKKSVLNSREILVQLPKIQR